MKRFLTRAGAKVGRFVWSWGFLKFVLALVLLIVVFYVEEDWRGAHRWAANKAKWEAKGETFDYAKFVPPPIPDDQNLAAIPLFKLEPPSKTDPSLEPLVLQKAMRHDVLYSLPSLSNGKAGGSPDLAKIRSAIAKNFALVFPGVKPPGDALGQFETLYPFLKDFLAASSTRPLCRLPGDYTTALPAGRSLRVVVAGIDLSRILTYHAILALDEHQPELALADIKANYTVLSGAKRDPTLVGGLVAIGMTAIIQPAIADGLGRHAWSDAHLVEMEQLLKRLNFLDDFQFAMRCEAAESTANIDYFERVVPRQYFRQMGEASLPAMVRFMPPWPQGWWGDNKSQITDLLLRELGTVDPRGHRAFPEIDHAFKAEVARAQARWDANAPWNFFSTQATPPMSDLTVKYAIAQARIDEARIAIALERYRLARGAYPASLAALAPAFIDELPHDVVNGEPYHYRLQANANYLLYSLGWNQTDEGGKVVYEQDLPKDLPARIDYEQGDWPWLMPK
jgi:hypothetical protein